MTASEMVKVIRQHNQTEKPTKGFGEWTTDEDLAEALSQLGFTVREGTTARGRHWVVNCNGNRFRAIIKTLREAGWAGSKG